MMFASRSENSSRDDTSKFRIHSEIWIRVSVILIFCIFLFMIGVGRWDLWNPDEPRYAQVAKEMVQGGDWVLMHLNGRIYGDKPPLFFWLTGLSSILWQEFDSFSVRFPSALFGTLTVVATFLLGIMLYSLRTGFFSGPILATSLEFAYLSTRANIDTTLTFFTTASLLSFFLWLQHSKESKSGKSRGIFLYSFYIVMGLATLAKGPVGFIFPLLISLIFLIIQRDWKSIKEMRILKGMLLFLAIVLAWYVPAVLKGGNAYLKETLFKHTVDAYAKGWTHVRPIHYYLWNFPLDFLPCILFLPGAFVSGFWGMKKRGRKEFLFLLVWFLFIFLFFSFSKGKRPIYLLPLYPAASLLVGRFWDCYFSSTDHYPLKLFISLAVRALAGSLFLMGAVLLLIPFVADLPIGVSAPSLLKTIVKGAEAGAGFLSYIPRLTIIIFASFLLGSGVILFWGYLPRYKSITFGLIVAIFAFGFFYGTRIIFPMVNPYKSARFLCQEIRQIIKPGKTLAIYGGFGTGPYNFYTGIVPITELENERELDDFFRSKERIFCLFKYGDYERFKREKMEIPFHLISERYVGDYHIVFVSNQ